MYIWQKLVKVKFVLVLQTGQRHRIAASSSYGVTAFAFLPLA